MHWRTVLSPPRRLTRLRSRYFFLIDAILLTVAPMGLFALRFEGLNWPSPYETVAVVFTAIVVPLQLGIFVAFGLYRRLWRYASIAEVELIFIAGVVAAVPSFLLGRYVVPLLEGVPVGVPLSVLVPNAILTIGIIGTPRLLVRMASLRSQLRHGRQGDKRVLIAGAGAAGEMILKELRANHDLSMVPVGFVDDDRSKHGLKLSNLPILGALADIPTLARELEVQQVIIAMPRATGAVVREVVRAAQEAGVEARTIPALFEILSGSVRVSAIREVRIEDLLRREPVQTDLAKVFTLACDRTVMVTGGGGSIGRELCRQLAALSPSSLIVLDHAENAVFEVCQELNESGVGGAIIPVVADVRDRDRLRRLFANHRPDVIFHAAAHKHVPLMEDNSAEAITNNVLGTKNLVETALEAGTERFVLISTDKAVRPTNVMGATKRVAEYVVHNAAVASGRKYVSVRFGNVLGSQASVVPTFVRQIQLGGPVTVTHPEMRRYFMTIPEAVQLVLQAGALGGVGDLFMLDMGEPVKILDLARDMIRLSGLQEGVDIQIKFTGVRPGEKLYEEMFFSHEVAEATEHPKILRARNGHAGEGNDASIEQLVHAARRGAAPFQLRELLRQLVPDYHTVPPLLSVTENSEDAHAYADTAQRRIRRSSGASPVIA